MPQGHVNIPAAAIDAKGRILRQPLLGAIPNGRFGSDYNGCGWIACYNLLLELGAPAEASALIRELAPWRIFGGRWGTFPAGLRRVLRRRGFAAAGCWGPRRIRRRAAGFSRGIVFYLHPRGGHYAAFSRAGGGVTVYNFGDGQAWFPSLAALLDALPGPACWCLGLPV